MMRRALLLSVLLFTRQAHAIAYEGTICDPMCSSYCVGGGSPGALCDDDTDCSGGTCESDCACSRYCVGGSSPGATCSVDADCPSGACKNDCARFKSTFHNCTGYSAGDSVLICTSMPGSDRGFGCWDNDSHGSNIWHTERDTYDYGFGVKLVCATALQIPDGSNWDSITCIQQQSSDASPPLSRTGLGMRFSGVTTREPGDRYQQAKGSSRVIGSLSPRSGLTTTVPYRVYDQDLLVLAVASQTNAANNLTLNSPWGVTTSAARTASGSSHRLDMAVLGPLDRGDPPLHNEVTGSFDLALGGNWIGTVIVLSAGPAPPPTATPAPRSPTPTPLAPLAEECPNKGLIPRPTASTIHTLFDVPAGDSIIMACGSNSRGAFDDPPDFTAIGCSDSVGNFYGVDADLSQLPPVAYNRATICASLRTSTFLPAGSPITMTHSPSGNTCCVAKAYPRSIYNIIPTTNPTPNRTPGVRNGLPGAPTPPAGDTGQGTSEDTGPFMVPYTLNTLIVSALSVIAPCENDACDPVLSAPYSQGQMVEVGKAFMRQGDGSTLNRQLHLGDFVHRTPTPSTAGTSFRRVDTDKRKWVAVAAQYPMAGTFTPVPTLTSTPSPTPTNTIDPAAPTRTFTRTPTLTPTVTPTDTARPLGYVRVVGVGTSATPWPTEAGPEVPNGIAVPLTTTITGGARHSLFVGYVAADSDCYPFTATDTKSNAYGWDVVKRDTSIRGAQFASVNLQTTVGVGDYVIVAPCVGVPGVCGSCNQTSASRSAWVMQVDGIKDGTGPGGSTNPTPNATPGNQNAPSIGGAGIWCIGTSGSSSNPHTDNIASASANRVLVGSVGVIAAEPTIGFCQSNATPATPGATPTGTPGPGPQKCISGNATPQYQYPTPTPASGQIALPFIGTMSFSTDRVVAGEMIQQANPASAIPMKGYLFKPGTVTAVSKNWVATACWYRAAVE